MKETIEYRCKIVFWGTEGVSDGEVWLTDEEFELVEKVLNPSNWENANWDTWSGSASIKKIEP